MKKRGKIHLTLGVAAFMFIALATDRYVLAQESETPDESANAIPEADMPDEEVEEVIITGSRIRTNPLDAPAPILNLSEQDMKRTGLTSVGDILQRLPISGGGLNTKFNSSGNFGFPPNGGGIGAGASQVDLRYLGSNRVLVLVDGVRWVNSSSASGVASATDLNTIPASIIDRIEILEDGASAIYGSDAIAGVVNIITKKNYEGVEANAYMGGFHKGDGFVQKYDLSWGTVSDRMSMSLNLSYVRAGEILAKDRAISRDPIPGHPDCTPAQCSSGTPQGRFFFFADPSNPGNPIDASLIDNDTPIVNLTINNGVGGIPAYNPADPGGGGDDFHPFATVDRFNYSPYNMMLTPSERFGMFTKLTYELTDSINVNVRALFNNRQSTNQAAPEPLFVGSEAGNGNKMDTVSIDVTNPYNPFGFTLDAERHAYFIGRRPLEAGSRIYKQNVNTWYLSTGLDGAFSAIQQSFYWDITAIYSQNRADQVKYGAFNSEKIKRALGPIDVCDADPQCVPLNLFGGMGADGNGSITGDMLDYISFVQKDLSQQTLFDLSANVTGSLVNLPAGPLGLAIGYEYRKQDGFFRPDAVVTAGDTAGIPSQPSSGGFNVNELYAEIAVPILSEMPGFEMLDITGAVRYSDYSTFGSTQTFKAGARWRPIEGLMVRGGYSQGFRAPGIGELFGSEARYDRVMSDPCSDYMQSGDQTVIDYCKGLGIPESFEQTNPQIGIRTGGNSSLDPETSESISASLVFSPTHLLDISWADQLDFEASFFWIKLDNAIRARNAQTKIDLCAHGDQKACEGISRTGTGVIYDFENNLINIGGLKTKGIDVNLTYTSPETSAGRFRFIFMGTYLMDFVEIVDTDAGLADNHLEGTEIGDPEQAFPEFKFSIILGWAMGDFSASFTTRFIDSVTEPCVDLEDFPGTCSSPHPTDPTNKIDATIYNDIQLTWIPEYMDEQFIVTLGVNNILNQEPPVCYSCSLNNFDATTFDVPGIYGYLNLGYRM